MSCGNTFFELVFFFTKGLQNFFGLSKSQIVLTIWILQENKIEDAKPIKYLLENMGFSRITIRKRRSEKKRARQFLLEARANIKVLSLILGTLAKDLSKLLKKSPNSVKASYIAGFASAEGSIVKDSNSRRLNISQKDLNKLIFIKELLNDLGFKSVTTPEPNRKAFRICISRRRELEKYIEEIGFGHHELRNQKMREILNSYSKAEHKLKVDRINEILKLLKQNKTLTGPKIAYEIGVTYKHVNGILNDMVRNSLIKVDNSSKPFNYIL